LAGVGHGTAEGEYDVTREQFTAAHRDKIMGMICNALLNRQEGPELSLALRAAQAKVDALLGEMHEQLTKQPPPRPPGTPAPPPNAVSPVRGPQHGR
jgi:hypothetical protein